MKNEYGKFIEKFQNKLDEYFKEYSEFIYCHQGCANCCEIGEYPFSWVEMCYLMKAFVELPEEIKQIIKRNVLEIRRKREKFKGERFLYACPFLVNKSCCVYSHRGITCRTHGLAYLKKDGNVNVPYCANEGLNFSSVYNDGIFSIEPIKENLDIDTVLKDFNGEMGEIRPLIEWFEEL